MEALSRELWEELGIRIEMTSVVPLASVVAGSPEDPAQITAWLIRAWHGMPENLAPEEHLAIQWIDMDQLPPLANRSVHRALAQAVRGQDPATEF